MTRRNIGERAILKLIQLVIDKFKIERQELESIIQEKVNDIKFPISNSSAVTESDKFALDAIQNNPSVNDTLANKLSQHTI